MGGQGKSNRAIERVGREQGWGDSKRVASKSREKECVWGWGRTKMRRCEGKLTEVTSGSGSYGEGSPTLQCRAAKDEG